MNNKIFRKLEKYRVLAQASKYSGDMVSAKFYAYLYGQTYRKMLAKTGDK